MNIGGLIMADDLSISKTLGKTRNNAYDAALKFRQMLSERKVRESGNQHFAVNSLFANNGNRPSSEAACGRTN